MLVRVPLKRCERDVCVALFVAELLCERVVDVALWLRDAVEDNHNERINSANGRWSGLRKQRRKLKPQREHCITNLNRELVLECNGV